MYTEILEHDTQNGIAKIRFSHNGVTHEQTYDLGLVVPGTRKVLADTGADFTLELQNKVIDKLTTQIQHEIEIGVIENRI